MLIWSELQGGTAFLKRLLVAVSLSMLISTAFGGETKKEIEFELVHLKHAIGGLGSAYFAVRSSQDWVKFSNFFSAQLPDHSAGVQSNLVPAVDFTRYTLLVANAGVKMSGPNYIAFKSVVDTGADIQVNVETHSAGTCPRVEVIRQSYALALIPRTTKPIRFEVLDKACNSSGEATITITHY